VATAADARNIANQITYVAARRLALAVSARPIAAINKETINGKTSICRADSQRVPKGSSNLMEKAPISVGQ